MYADSKVDAVMVCTPTHYHEDIIVNALNSGKHVFAEKPVSESPEGVTRCYEKVHAFLRSERRHFLNVSTFSLQAKKVGKTLFCAFNRRFDPSFANIRERVHNGMNANFEILKF